MTLSQLTVSLDLAQQLEKSGFPQKNCLHYWGLISGSGGIWCSHSKDDLDDREKRFNWIASPTSTEILEELPHNIGDILKETIGLQIRKSATGYQVYLWDYEKEVEGKHPLLHWEEDRLLVNACAKMYLHLNKQGLLSK